jgi:hypothetical protein
MVQEVAQAFVWPGLLVINPVALPEIFHRDDNVAH